MATPVDPDNRLIDLGPATEIEVPSSLLSFHRSAPQLSCRGGLRLTLRVEPRRSACSLYQRAISHDVLFIVQQHEVDIRALHG